MNISPSFVTFLNQKNSKTKQKKEKLYSDPACNSILYAHNIKDRFMDLISHLLFSLLPILRSFTERTKVEGDCYYYFQCSYSPISSRSLELYPHQYHIRNRLFILILTVLLLLLNDYSTIFDWLICIPVTLFLYLPHQLFIIFILWLNTILPLLILKDNIPSTTVCQGRPHYWDTDYCYQLLPPALLTYLPRS